MLYSMKVPLYVVVKFIAVYSERTGSVSQHGDLANGHVIRVFMNVLCSGKTKG